VFFSVLWLFQQASRSTLPVSRSTCLLFWLVLLVFDVCTCFSRASRSTYQLGRSTLPVSSRLEWFSLPSRSTCVQVDRPGSVPAPVCFVCHCFASWLVRSVDSLVGSIDCYCFTTVLVLVVCCYDVLCTTLFSLLMLSLFIFSLSMCPYAWHSVQFRSKYHDYGLTW
jgi:hypothetical protein